MSGHLILGALAAAALASSLDKTMLRKVIASHTAELRHCYERALERRPSVEGKITVVFHVTSEGAVDEAGVKTSTVDDAPLEQCVVDSVRGWRFPPGPKPGFQVSFPFIFKPE